MSVKNKIFYNITLKYFLFQKVNDIYKQVLQNPELVLQNIVERSITSKDQVTIYTEVYMHMKCKKKCLSNERPGRPS
jgi:aspartate carbamoyltransferase regulatory subunit